MNELEVASIIFFGSLFVAAILVLILTRRPPVIIQNEITEEIRYID